MNEIVSIHIGQCGVQLAQPVWQLYCQQHRIQGGGQICSQKNEEQNPHVIYHESQNNKMIPRAILFDTDPIPVAQFKKKPIGKIFNGSNMLSGKSGCSNIFPRAMYTEGRTYIEDLIDKTRIQIEKCDNLNSLMFYHSTSGATGSGMCSLLIERLKNQSYLRKKLIINHCVLPSINYSDTVVSHYNTIMTIPYLNQSSDAIICYDNQSLYKIFQNKLDMSDPNFFNINSLIAQIPAAMSSGVRSRGQFTPLQICQNLIPFSSMKFIIPSYAPFLAPDSQKLSLIPRNFEQEIFNTENKLFFQNIMNKNNNSQQVKGKNLACSLILRGQNNHILDIRSSLRNKIIQNQIKFIDWIKTCLKVCNSNLQPKNVLYSGIGHTCHNATLLSNNIQFKNYLKKIAIKYDKLYQNRAMVHWFIGEGASADFPCSREQINRLMRDYQQLQSE